MSEELKDILTKRLIPDVVTGLEPITKGKPVDMYLKLRIAHSLIEELIGQMNRGLPVTTKDNCEALLKGIEVHSIMDMGKKHE